MIPIVKNRGEVSRRLKKEAVEGKIQCRFSSISNATMVDGWMQGVLAADLDRPANSGRM